MWDPRTITLAPNTHRNVHSILVRIMKQIPVVLPLEDPTAFQLLFYSLPYELRKMREAKIALLAPQRWVQADGSLDFLVTNKLYGEA